MKANKLLSNIIALALALPLSMLTGCGNNPKPATSEVPIEDTTVTNDTKPQPIDTTGYKPTPRSQEEVKESWDEFNRKNGYGKDNPSKAYDEGYDAGFEQGTDDAANGLEWHGMYDDSNRYKGKAKADYEDGYEYGYQDGYEAEHSGGEPEEW